MDTAPEQQMKPLTTHQEVLLSSDDRDNDSTGQVNAENKFEQENGEMEGRIDRPRDYSSPESDNNIQGDYRTVDDFDIGSELVNDSKTASNDIDDAPKHVSVQEDSWHESACDDELIVPSENQMQLQPENTVDSFSVYGFRDFDSNLAVDTADSNAYLKENLFNAEPGNMPNYNGKPLDLNNEQRDEITSSSGSRNSDISKTPSSLGAYNETETVSIVVNPEPNNTISDPKFLSEDDQENNLSASKKENLDLNKTPHVSYEGNKSSFEEQSIPENVVLRKSVFTSSTDSLVDEQVRNENNEVNKVRFESPNSGSFFSAPGIPAPSVVSAAVQVLPGKVLIPAAVDQVQGQALAALQVLKVIIYSHSHG